MRKIRPTMKRPQSPTPWRHKAWETPPPLRLGPPQECSSPTWRPMGGPFRHNHPPELPTTPRRWSLSGTTAAAARWPPPSALPLYRRKRAPMFCTSRRAEPFWRPLRLLRQLATAMWHCSMGTLMPLERFEVSTVQYSVQWNAHYDKRERERERERALLPGTNWARSLSHFNMCCCCCFFCSLHLNFGAPVHCFFPHCSVTYLVVRPVTRFNPAAEDHAYSDFDHVVYMGHRGTGVGKRFDLYAKALWMFFVFIFDLLFADIMSLLKIPLPLLIMPAQR